MSELNTEFVNKPVENFQKKPSTPLEDAQKEFDEKYDLVREEVNFYWSNGDTKSFATEYAKKHDLKVGYVRVRVSKVKNRKVKDVKLLIAMRQYISDKVDLINDMAEIKAYKVNE